MALHALSKNSLVRLFFQYRSEKAVGKWKIDFFEGGLSLEATESELRILR